MGAKVAAEGEDGVEVDLDDFVEVAVGEGLARVSALDACAVHQDPDFLVAVIEDLGGESGDGLGRAQIGSVDGSFAAEGADGL